DDVDDAAGDGKLIDVDVGDTDLADLPLVLKILQRADRLLVRDLRIRGVQLVEVDPLEAEASQRALACLAQVLRAAIARPETVLALAVADGAALGRDDEVVRVGTERLGDQLLADLGAVGVGGVDQIDAELDRAPEHGDRFVAVRGRAEDFGAGDPHRAEAEPADLEVAEGDGSWGLVGERCGAHISKIAGRGRRLGSEEDDGAPELARGTVDRPSRTTPSSTSPGRPRGPGAGPGPGSAIRAVRRRSGSSTRRTSWRP